MKPAIQSAIFKSKKLKMLTRLESNPFMQSIKTNFPDLLHYASQKNVIICIPQSASLLEQLTLPYIQQHCLQLTDVTGQYQTLTGQTVVISASRITTADGFDERRTCRILLTEQLDIGKIIEQRKIKPITILYLNRPLSGGVNVHVPEDEAEMDPRTLQRYMAIIRSYPFSEIAFRELDYFIEFINRTAESGELRRFGTALPSLVREHWKAAVYQMLQGGALENESIMSTSRPRHQLQIEQVVESYIMQRIHEPVFHHFCTTLKEEDKKLQEVLKKMRHYTQTDFGIIPVHQCEQLEAIDYIHKLKDCRTPLDMLLCLRDCTQSIDRAIRESLKHHNSAQQYQITTDELLDQLLYIILRSSESDENILERTRPPVPFIAILKYITEFHFVNSSSNALGFMLANLEVGIEWFLMRSGNDKSFDPPSARVQTANMLNVVSNNMKSSSPNSADPAVGQKHFIAIHGRMADPNSTETITSYEHSSKPYSEIACGRRFFAAVGQNGGLYTWGLAQAGRLGHQSSQKYVLQPTLIQSLQSQNIVHVSCGDFHALATDSNGYVYCWGDGRYGQLGLPESILKACQPSHIVQKPIRLRAFGGAYVSIVACGSTHSLALTSQGRVFSWGCPKHGKLGRKTGLNTIPHIVHMNWSGQTLEGNRRPDKSIGICSTSLNDEEGSALRISCGQNHSLVVTRDGAVFSWGCGHLGRLGLSSHSDQSLPKQIMALSSPSIQIVQACGGKAHSMFLTRNGVVLACGSNEFGQLGGDTSTLNLPLEGPGQSDNCVASQSQDCALIPQTVSNLAQILLISCGEDHTSALDKSGHVWSWGSNLNAQIQPKATEGNPSDFVIKVPRQISSSIAREISCKGTHTMISQLVTD